MKAQKKLAEKKRNNIIEFVDENPLSTFWTILFLSDCFQSIYRGLSTDHIGYFISGILALLILVGVWMYMGWKKMTELVDDSPVIYFITLLLLSSLALLKF